MAFCPTLFSVTPVVTSLLVHHLFILSESAQAAITKQSRAGAETTKFYVFTVVESGSPQSLGSEACAWQGLASWPGSSRLPSRCASHRGRGDELREQEQGDRSQHGGPTPTTSTRIVPQRPHLQIGTLGLQHLNWGEHNAIHGR